MCGCRCHQHFLNSSTLHARWSLIVARTLNRFDPICNLLLIYSTLIKTFEENERKKKQHKNTIDTEWIELSMCFSLNGWYFDLQNYRTNSFRSFATIKHRVCNNVWIRQFDESTNTFGMHKIDNRALGFANYNCPVAVVAKKKLMTWERFGSKSRNENKIKHGQPQKKTR